MNKKGKLNKIKEFILNLLFPKFCLGCKKEGEYLCQDCKAVLEISEYQYCLCKNSKRVIEIGKCQKCQTKKLNGLYFATDYQSSLIKELIKKFKYEPFAKEIAKDLACLILDHFLLIEKSPQKDFADFLVAPVPLEKSREKWRGFNQAEEIGKELSKYLKIPQISDILIKIKKTLPQVKLSQEQREKNVKEVFWIKNRGFEKKKILLIDDVYTTGSTMEECARVLKKAGAKEVWGVVVARE